MAGKGFSVSIGVSDQATAGIDKINKRIAALTAPAEKFNRSLAKFGDVSGINRAADGIGSLGIQALEAGRAIERMVSPIGALTSAGSLAGIAALSKAWATAGTQVGKTAYMLNTPVGRLSELQGAARLAGSSASAMDNSLKGLGQTLSGAAYGRDASAVSMFNTLGISFRDASGGARNAADALGDVADAVSKYSDKRTQVRVLDQLGIDQDLLPLLTNGRKGLDEFMRQADATGGVMSKGMVEAATKMNKAWAELGLAIDGVENSLGEKWSGTITGAIDSSAKWIEQNKKTAESIAEIGAAVSAFGAIKLAGWAARLLGLGLGVSSATVAAAISTPLLSGDTPNDPTASGRSEPTQNPGYFGEHGVVEQWIRNRVSQVWHSVGGTSRGIRNNNPLNLEYRPGQGATSMDGRFGIYPTMREGIAADARQLLRYQDQYGLNTVEGIVGRWAPSSDGNDTGSYVAEVASSIGVKPDSPLDLHDPRTLGGLVRAMGRHETGQNIDVEDVAQGTNDALNGRVQVDVTIKAAPHGTTAQVVSSGAAHAPPPRVETSMPLTGR